MLGNGVFHGMYNPSVVWANDNRLLFDGVNDYITVKNFKDFVDNDFADSFSVSFWFQHKGLVNVGSNQTFFRLKIGESGEEIKVIYDTLNAWVYVSRDESGNKGSVDSSHTLALSHANFQNQHNHFVITMANGSGLAGINVYINSSDGGSTSGTGDEWGSIESLDYRFTLGSDGATKYLNGYMNNIAIYDRVLSSTDVGDIYNNGEPKNELTNTQGDPVIYYVTNEKNFESNGDHNTMSGHTIEITGATIEPNV